MALDRLVYFTFLLTQGAVVYSTLPQIQKCQLQDGNCLKSSAQSVVPVFTAGIPEVGSEILDPMPVNVIKVDLSGLKLTVRDSIIKGLANSVIDKLSVDMKKKQMQLVYHADLTLDGKYKASGKLLILPISGDGDAHIALKNCVLSMDILFDVVKNNEDKDVIELKSYRYKYDVKDNASFRLTNLFNGNRQLSDAMLSFMNSNWKALTLEFGTPMFDKPIRNVFDAIKAYMKSQPLDQIANV